MLIKPMHPNFKMPVRSTEHAAGYDIFMPEKGTLHHDQPSALKVALGFATQIPVGYVAVLAPRSGAGAKFGVELNNTLGYIDADYRNEWFAFLRLKNHEPFSWEAGDRLLQFILKPVFTPELVLSDTLDETTREGGFGSTGR